MTVSGITIFDNDHPAPKACDHSRPAPSAYQLLNVQRQRDKGLNGLGKGTVRRLELELVST
jgi:hypothetical protein